METTTEEGFSYTLKTALKNFCKINRYLMWSQEFWLLVFGIVKSNLLVVLNVTTFAFTLINLVVNIPQVND